RRRSSSSSCPGVSSERVRHRWEGTDQPRMRRLRRGKWLRQTSCWPPFLSDEYRCAVKQCGDVMTALCPPGRLRQRGLSEIHDQREDDVGDDVLHGSSCLSVLAA